MKLLAGIVGGLIIASLGNIFLAGGGVIMFLLLLAVGVFVAMTAPTAAKAWRRLLISSGVLSALLSLPALALVASPALGGGLVGGLMGFLGLFLALVFIVVGLLIGRDKPVTETRDLPQ